MNLKKDLEFVAEVARNAGDIALKYYGKVARLTKTHQAASAEAVTEADRATQRFIVAALRKRFPGDGIIGEEDDSGKSITFDCPDPDGRVWVIDPIDGTNNFVANFGNFAVCIGLLEKGCPILGVVYDVTRGEVLCAASGHGAFRNGQPVRALTTPLNNSSVLMMTANLLDKHGHAPAFASRWISQTTWKIRIIGSASLEACMVGIGIAHGAITINGKLWDAAAAAAIVLEAGGLMTDLKGNPIFPFDLRGYAGAKVPFLAAAPSAHATLLKEIAT